MALAIECDQLIREGVINNQSELAHYGSGYHSPHDAHHVADQPGS